MGAVQFGMTLKEAAAAMRRQYSVRRSEGCELVTFSEHWDYFILGSGGRIFTACTTSGRFVTDSGIRSGDSVAKMRQLSSGNLKLEGSTYVYSPSDPEARGNVMTFDAYEGKVMKICAGPRSVIIDGAC
jgi:hypothetical protein